MTLVLLQGWDTIGIQRPFLTAKTLNFLRQAIHTNSRGFSYYQQFVSPLSTLNWGRDLFLQMLFWH